MDENEDIQHLTDVLAGRETDKIHNFGFISASSASSAMPNTDRR